MTNETRPKVDLTDPDEAISRWADTVWRLALARMRNEHDAADAFQNTFLALCKARPVFNSLEHQKAWLLRTACNCCNQIRRAQAAHPMQPLEGIDLPDEHPALGADIELDQMLAQLSDA